MAHLTIRNRDTGITLESHDFAPETRLSLYETYMPGERIMCGNARYHVRSCAWIKASQEFVVGVTFESDIPAVDDVWC